MRALPLSLLMVASLLAGCGDPPSDYGPVQADVIVSDEVDFDYLWDVTLRVLRRAGLTPDRQDRREGIITSLPITCQQWFEFWRHDAMGPYQWAEASMHTIQRLAVVKINRRPEPGRFHVIVKVDVFRHSAPERQVTTASGALLMYSQKLPTEQGERLERHEGVHWVHLGRDPDMEGALLKRILVQYPGSYEVVEEPLEDSDLFDTEAPADEVNRPDKPQPPVDAEPAGPPAPSR